MSMAKYRKLFAYLQSLGIESGQVKTVWSDDICPISLWEDNVPGYTADGLGGPYSFREIDVLFIGIPAHLDVDDVTAGLDRIGKFVWEQDGPVLKIMAYSHHDEGSYPVRCGSASRTPPASRRSAGCRGCEPPRRPG